MATPTDGPRTGYEERWRAHNSQRRELILSAAAGLVEQSRPGAPISVQRIANRADLAKSVVYRQFKNKDDLVRSLRGYVVDTFADELERDLDISTGSLRSILRRAIASAAEWMEDHPRLVELLRSGPTDHDAAGSGDAMGEFRHRIVVRGQATIEAIGEIIDRDSGPFTDVPFVVFAMVESTLTSWVRGEELIHTRTRDEIVDTLTDITWSVLDGTARGAGLQVDPDAEFSTVVVAMAPTATAPPSA
ncbi:TetR/AcrR family transcriptional regulator [Tsukamurella sp. 8F]|uniref:TetR/AcrR family transcriptional regulator n=1 Tax=unclassified Tsukamurella TaxID=2633480 RepID=UPI0023B8FC8F|nr:MULTISPECIES: TetR/AcrR family transcriptional regulator [unclassified Tsukamurella]MDF0532337.1 TetR/AcrR family transcriptional regulator [Tsukamurella sp. 8J]MDF0589455.1 TetR/AcrR family transcriptional regulator [Tsukamurella sp. 8F]